MQTKKVAELELLVIISLGILLFRVLSLDVVPENAIQDSSEVRIEHSAVLPDQEQKEARVGLPVRLTIPSIKVDAPVEYVGLTPEGAMDVPGERAHTAWFELGKRPGENGSAVIAGHYGWKNSKAVFDDLYTLQKGDKIYVEDENGEVISFVVRESRSYDPEADASDVFGSLDGRSHLNLITCEGVWDSVSKTYSNRLVVFADKE
ncbi:MAG: class F sortase [bacterium]|nr:class F sortase [bacterium]